MRMADDARAGRTNSALAVRVHFKCQLERVAVGDVLICGRDGENDVARKAHVVEAETPDWRTWRVG
jgi:hypothetical protein